MLAGASISTRLCTDQFIRGKVSDKVQEHWPNRTPKALNHAQSFVSYLENETNPVDRARLCCSPAVLWSIAVLFILAIHGITSVRR